MYTTKQTACKQNPKVSGSVSELSSPTNRKIKDSHSAEDDLEMDDPQEMEDVEG